MNTDNINTGSWERIHQSQTDSGIYGEMPL